ncbi:MAG: hypothetical protein A2Z21_08435 [Candidatus Fraserbacteria bacterium RBG_16_55_9]|uniref:BrnT family toxin n=1 Tax=Fraserbacteria sp. (strain RBG_16_55_9) TaxID=1817864 RepID=A0A1F5UQF1_FRAXR|nr:MAG: hypothetical protein A2Z21_08435 [Candidatus Fraserbacteria bacterium RBG_16_55_9]
MEFYISEFDWDEANAGHIQERHQVSAAEVEQCFSNRRKITKKPGSQDRFYLFSKTDGGRHLFIVFQYKGLGIVRPISARDMDKRERKFYENP